MRRANQPGNAADAADQVLVHRLVDPGPIVDHAADLGRLLFGVTGDDPDRAFDVAAASGALSFLDHGYLAATPAQATVTAEDVEATARQALAGYNGAVEGAALDGVPALFPADNLTLIDITPVAGPDAGPNHWLVRFGPTLATGRGDERLPVEAGVIEVRIGLGGEVVALVSPWRPIASSELVAATPYQPADADALPPVQLYLLADENAPQSQLAPYWCTIVGSDGALAPASERSLLAGIWQRTTEDGLQVAAEVLGGSGQYAFAWIAWDPTTVLDEGFRDLGSEQGATVPAQFQVVALSVVDTATGATVQVEQFVFPSAA